MKSRLIALIVFAALLAGCGSGGGGQGSTAPAGKPATLQASSAGGQGGTKGAASGKGAAAPKDTSAGFAPSPHHDSAGGAAQFERKGADNSIQESGAEASGSELARAAAALHGYLDARAARAWRAACSYMASGLAASMGQLAGAEGGKQPSCPQLIAALSAVVPPAALREAARADVGALRVEGSCAFLLFHGAHGASYFMPMARSGGEWKVAAISASALQ